MIQENPPDTPKNVPAVMRDYIDRLSAYLKRQRPVPGVGVSIGDADGGGMLINAQGAAGGTGTSHPFLCLDASKKDQARVRIVSGAINGFDPVSDGPFESGDSPPYVLNVEDGNVIYVIVEVSFDDDALTWNATGFDVQAGDSLPEETSSEAFFPIGSVSINPESRVVSVADGVSGNIGWRRCGTADDTISQWGPGP